MKNDLAFAIIRIDAQRQPTQPSCPGCRKKSAHYRSPPRGIPCLPQAPVAQRKSIGLLIRRSGVRILPGASPERVRSAAADMTTSFVLLAARDASLAVSREHRCPIGV